MGRRSPPSWRGFAGKVYHYVPNVLGRNMMLSVGAVSLVAALVVGLLGDGALWSLVVAGALAVAFLGALFYVAHWLSVAQSHFIALDDDHLYVGSNKRAWRLEWGLLDTRSSGLAALDTTTTKSVLPMRVAGQAIDVPLYHPLMHIDDLQGFMFELLGRMPGAGAAEES